MSEVRFSYTSEEIFIATALNLLMNDSLFTRQKAYKYLKFLPDDILEDLQLRELRSIILSVAGKGNGELSNPDELFKKIVSKIAGSKKLSSARFANLYALPSLAGIPIALPFLHELATELLSKWKERKRKYIQQVIASSKNLSDEQLQAFINELVEIENFSPFPDAQEELEEDKLLSMASKPEDFNIDFLYLYDDFLPQGMINLWVAPAAQGKSALALALSCYLLDQGKIDKVLYFDGDNPLAVLKKRKIDDILERYKDRLFYFQINTAKEFQELVKKTQYIKGKVLIVIDTLRAFVGAQDINKGEVAEKVMAFFRELTRSGKKTVIILHHVNKPPRDATVYTLMDRVKGATEFRDRADIAYFFTKKNQDEEAVYIALENIKPRIPVKQKINFKVDVENAKLEEVGEILTKEEQEFVSAVVNEINTFSKMKGRYPNKYQLENALRDRGFGRNQIRAWLDKFNNKFWRQTLDELYNQIIFKPILQNGEVAKWQTGELRNNTGSGKSTPNTPINNSSNNSNTKTANWQSRRSGELSNNEDLNIVDNVNNNEQYKTSGELRNDETSPVRHPENSKKSSKTPINTNFASSPPSLPDDFDIKDIPPEVLKVCGLDPEELTPEQIKTIKEWGG